MKVIVIMSTVFINEFNIYFESYLDVMQNTENAMSDSINDDWEIIQDNLISMHLNGKWTIDDVTIRCADNLEPS